MLRHTLLRWCTAGSAVSNRIAAPEFGTRRRRRQRAALEDLRSRSDAESKQLVKWSIEELPEAELAAIEKDAKKQVQDRCGFLHPPLHMQFWRHFWRELQRYEQSWHLASTEAPIFKWGIIDRGYGGGFSEEKRTYVVSDSRVMNPMSDILTLTCRMFGSDVTKTEEIRFVPPGVANSESLFIDVKLHPSVGEVESEHHRKANSLAQVVTVRHRSAGNPEKVLVDKVSLQTFALLQIESLMEFLRRKDIGVPNHVMTPKEQLKETERIIQHMRHLALMKPQAFVLEPHNLDGQH